MEYDAGVGKGLNVDLRSGNQVAPGETVARMVRTNREGSCRSAGVLSAGIDSRKCQFMAFNTDAYRTVPVMAP
jgi:hypothetical protein